MRERTWLWRVGLAVVGLVLALGLAACGDDDDDDAAADGDAAPVSLRVGYVTTAQHPYGQAVDNFAKEVAAATTDSVTFEQIPAYGGDLDLLADVRSGAVDAATVSSATFDTADVNAFQALQGLFLIQNYEVERAVITGDIAEDMLANLERDVPEVVALAIHEGGLRSPLGREKPLVAPADFEGLKIRAPQSEVLAAGLTALGAEVTPLPLPEVFPALQNGTVDGMEANLGLIAGEKYYEVAKYFTGNTPFWPFPTILMINRDKFDSLSEDQQTAIRDAGANAGTFSLDLLSTPGSTLPQDLANCGLEYVTASDADKAALEEAGAAALETLGGGDPETAEFITRIQEAKEGAAAAAPPSLAFTAEAGVDCVLGG